MKSMEEMMAAAQKAAETIQKQMNEMQVKLDSIEVEGTAGGGLVKVRASAKGRILGVSIDDSLMVPDDKQILEDLVTAAFNDARDRADRVSDQQMREMQPEPAGGTGHQRALAIQPEAVHPRPLPSGPGRSSPAGAADARRREASPRGFG